MAQTIVTLPERPRILALAHTLTAWAAALAFLLGLVAAGGAATVASAAPVGQAGTDVPLQPDAPASPTPAAQANDQDSRSMLPDVRVGFDGQTKAGRWLTVRAVVANDGPPIDGELRLASPAGGLGSGTYTPTVYSQPVELATRARKLLVFQVPGPTVPGDLELTLQARGQVIARRSVPLRVLGPTDFLVGVLSDDGLVPSGLGAVRRGGNPVAVGQVTTADLPTDPRALESLDALVIRQASSDRLTPQQLAALRSWIEQGGQLVVAGGPGWRRSIEGLDDLLPIDGLWTRQVKHLHALSRYAGVSPPDGNVLVTLGSPIKGARVFLTQDSIPLIVERWVGLGRVTFLGPDPAIEPFRSWPAADALWQRILVGGRPGLPTIEGSSLGASALRGVLLDMLDLGLPAPGWIATFLFGYVLVVGPGQYLVLRRMDRREWAWIGFPLLAVLAAGVILVGAAWLRGPNLRLAAVSISRVGDGTTSALLDTFVGVVAPTRGSYDLALADGQVPALLAEPGAPSAGPVTVATDPGGGPTRLPELRLEGRVVQGLQLQTLGPAATPIQADLKTTNGRLEGMVRNVGPDRLEDAVVLASGEALALGDIAPGESRPVSLSLPTTRTPGVAQNGPMPWSAPSPRAGLEGRRALTQQLLQPLGRSSDGETGGGVTFFGWTAASIPRVALEDQPVGGAARRLVEQSLPIDFGDQHLTIPPGLLGRTVLDGAALGRGGSSFVARGPIVFQFDLPPAVELSRIDRLTVHLSISGRPAATTATAGPGAPVVPTARISLYRWADRTWVDAPLSGTGVADMSFGSSFVDGGAIRARLEPQGSEVAVDQLDVSLEGEAR